MLGHGVNTFIHGHNVVDIDSKPVLGRLCTFWPGLTLPFLIAGRIQKYKFLLYWYSSSAAVQEPVHRRFHELGFQAFVALGKLEQDNVMIITSDIMLMQVPDFSYSRGLRCPNVDSRITIWHDLNALDCPTTLLRA